MLLEGVRLMVVGMTTVFAFLGVLVLAMHATRAVAARIDRGLPDDDARPDAPSLEDDRAIAVILAAVAARRGTVR